MSVHNGNLMTLYIRIKSCTEVVDKKGKTNTFVMQFQEYGTPNSAISSRFHGDKPRFKDEILEMPVKKYEKHRLLCDITTCSQDNPVILAQLVFHLALLPRNKQTKIIFVYPKTKYGVHIQASIEFHYSTNDSEPFDVPFKEIKAEEFQRSMQEGVNMSNNDNKRYTIKAAAYTDEDERARIVSEKIHRARDETNEEPEDDVQITKSSESKKIDSKSPQKTFVADMPVAPMVAPPPTNAPLFENQSYSSVQYKTQTQMPVPSPPPASSQLPPMDTWIDQRLTPVPKPPADRIQYFAQFQQTVKDYQAQYGPQHAKQYYDQYISYFQDCTSYLTYTEERKKFVIQYQQLQQQSIHPPPQYNTLPPQNPRMNYPTPQQQQSMQQIQMLQQQINMLISQQQQAHQQQQSMQQIQQLQQQVQFLQQQLQQQQNQQQNQQQQRQSKQQQFISNPIPVQNSQNPQQNIQYQQQYQYNQQLPMQNVQQNQYQSQYQQTQQTMISQPQNQYQTQYTMQQQPQYQTQYQYNYNQQMMSSSDSNPQLNFVPPPQQKLPNESQQLYSMPVMQQPQQPQLQQVQMMPPNQQIQPDQPQLQQLPVMPPPKQPTPPQPQLAPLPVMQPPQQQNTVIQNQEIPQLPVMQPQQPAPQQPVPQQPLPQQTMPQLGVNPQMQTFSQKNTTSPYNKQNNLAQELQQKGLPPPPNITMF